MTALAKLVVPSYSLVAGEAAKETVLRLMITGAFVAFNTGSW